MPYLTAQLDSPNAAVQGEAARVLAVSAGKEAFETLRTHFKKAAVKADALDSAEAAINVMRPWMDSLRAAGDQRACSLLLDLAGTSRHEPVRIHSARALRVLVDPAEGPAVYGLWKTTSDEKLKKMLQLVLQHGRAYGYTWDEARGDFKRTPAPSSQILPPSR
jgi:HEAT repeat protein